jgi:His-Xaa-Ser system radical SAM maturase HxsB
MPTSSSVRKFRDATHYYRKRNRYYLLPFNFIKISDTREVLVNFVGEFLFAPIGTAKQVIDREIEFNSEIYKDLIARFFISEECIPDTIDILATRYRTKKSFLDSFTSLHIFVVTLRCNHSCHYCQVSRVSENRSEYDMSDEDIFLGIHHMMKSPAKQLTMEFQGGEPLLAFEKIQLAIRATEELNARIGKQITFVICTNATIVSDEILDFCKQHRVLISTSVDGPEFIHNANRKTNKNDSYEKVVNGIEAFRGVLGNDQVGALMTTTSLSLDYPTQIIDTYIKLGFKNIFLRPISPYGFALRSGKKNKYDSEKFLDFYKVGLTYIIELNKRGLFFSEDYATIILKKILTPFPTAYVDLQSPAGMINSVVVFNYDGHVYASDEGRMLAENGDFTFKLGHVSDSYRHLFYGDKAKLFSEHWQNESLAGCSDCAFQLYCGADPVHHHATQGNLEGFRPTSSFCKKNMDIIRYLLNLIDESGGAVLPVFYSWIRNSN